MSDPFLAALVTAVATVTVAATSYLVNQQWKRRDRKADVYGEALRAVRAYEELPFRITRRSKSDPETRERVGNLISESFIELGYYRAWLLVDSSLIGDVYALLLNRTHRECRPSREAAWASALVSEDPAAHLGGKFLFDNKEEWGLCTRAMRRELSILAPIYRRVTRTELSRLIDARNLNPPISSDLTDRLRSAMRPDPDRDVSKP